MGTHPSLHLGELSMSSHNLIEVARNAADTGDFTEAKKFATNYLAWAEKQWSPHAKQDARYTRYCALPWYKKILTRKPDGRALPFRCRHAEDHMFAQSFLSAVDKRDVSGFTDRSH
jgi:hypothetical protein